MTDLQCRLIPEPDGIAVPKPGDMWLDSRMIVPGVRYGYHLGYFVSEQYLTQHAANRAPIWVVLPNGTWFCVDSAYTSGNAVGANKGWTVTGDAPNITVEPSINIVNLWHGWLRNGVLSDA